MDGVDRDTFILENMGLVRKIANQYKNRIYDSPHVDIDDLIQIGTIGLIKACDRFDPENGTKFSTYAVTSIKWEIAMFLRDKLDGVKVGGNTVYNYLDILQSNLISESPGVISSITGLSIQNVENALAYHRCKYIDSLDRSINDDDKGETYLSETIGYEVDFDGNLEKGKFQEILKGLSKRSREVLSFKLQGLNQYQIAKHLNITQSCVSRLLKKARKELEIGGIQMNENRVTDFKFAKQLAVETDLNANQISKQSGVSYPTAAQYIKQYRASEEEIEKVKKKNENNESPVTTYKLSPEELAKYRDDKIELPEKDKSIKSEIVPEVVKIEKMTANSYGHTSMIIETPISEATDELYKIVKALHMLGFESLKITVQGEKTA